MSDTPEPTLGLEPVPEPAKRAAYTVLARKYRPSDFSQLIGQEALVKTLTNAFAAGRIAHAFMLTGVRGVGKTTTARIIARALNCVGPDGKRGEPTITPCGVCEPCRAIAESRHVDVQEMDGASNNGVEEARQIIDSVRYAPASARYKVYIIDEVHMLSKPAFNALLKTLEEPPPHVKFVFATTEIRKVPVTILSRCQRFDLRRIESGELAAHLASIAAKENVAIDDGALALLARAGEGSVRDALSLLDQAIAHGEGAITLEAVRAMLGLADRGQSLDLFEKLMAGEIKDALELLRAQYDGGADPLAVMQDLMEICHFLTRLKLAPAAEGFFDGGSSEAKRASAMAARLSIPALSRAWSLLMKGLFEVRDAVMPLAACEMALIRLAYAADLPPTEKLVRRALDGEAAPASRPSPAPAPSGGSSGTPRAALAPVPRAETQSAPVLRSLEDIAALADPRSQLHVQLKNNVHLVRLEPGRLEFRPDQHAAKTLAAELSAKLAEWTGARWIVSISSEKGEPTIAEKERAAKAARRERVLQEPLVRAVMDRFPGAEIVALHDIAPEGEAPPPEPEEE
jgi:DNA polymerase III subunit gamma/tau